MQVAARRRDLIGALAETLLTRALTPLEASIKITGYTASSGRCCQVTMSSTTVSVILLIVSLEMSQP